MWFVDTSIPRFALDLLLRSPHSGITEGLQIERGATQVTVQTIIIPLCPLHVFLLRRQDLYQQKGSNSKQIFVQSCSFCGHCTKQSALSVTILPRLLKELGHGDEVVKEREKTTDERCLAREAGSKETVVF